MSTINCSNCNKCIPRSERYEKTFTILINHNEVNVNIKCCSTKCLRDWYTHKEKPVKILYDSKSNRGIDCGGVS